MDGAHSADTANAYADSGNYASNLYNNTLTSLSYGNAEIINEGNYYNMSKYVYERYGASSAYALYDYQNYMD